MAALSRLFALLPLLAAAATPAAAAPRAPTGKWVLNFAETQCLATREYGTKEQPLTLALRPSPNGEVYELILAQGVSGPRSARGVPAIVRIGDQPPHATQLLVYKLNKQAPRLARAPLPPIAAHQLRDARRIVIEARGDLAADLALAGTGALMREMDRCLLNLQDHWNISPFRASALRSFPEGSIQRVFSAEDYPDDAAFRGAEGSVEVRLLVDEQGKVADCMLTKPSGHALLDVQSCARIRQRAQYKPAVGADGKPARATTTGRINWRLAD